MASETIESLYVVYQEQQRHHLGNTTYSLSAGQSQPPSSTFASQDFRQTTGEYGGHTLSQAVLGAPRPSRPLQSKLSANSLRSRLTARVCANCGTNNTPLWRKEAGITICNACGIYLRNHGSSRPVELIRTTEAQTAKRDADALANPQAVVSKPVSTNEPRPPSKRRALSAQAGKRDHRRSSGYSSDSSSPSPSARRAGPARHQRKPNRDATSLHNSTGSLAKLAAKPHNPYARLLDSAAALQGEGGSSPLGKATYSRGQQEEQDDSDDWEDDEDALQESGDEQGSQRLHSVQGLHGLHADGRAPLGEGTSGQIPSFLAAHRQRLQQSTAARPGTTLPHSSAPGASLRQAAAGGQAPLHKRSHGVTKRQSGPRVQWIMKGSDEDYDTSGEGGNGAASDSSGDWGGPLLSRARKHGWTRAGLRGAQQQGQEAAGRDGSAETGTDGEDEEMEAGRVAANASQQSPYKPEVLQPNQLQLTFSSSIADVALAISSFMGQGDTLYNTCHDHTKLNQTHSDTHTSDLHSLPQDAANHLPETGPGTSSSQSQLLLDACAAADALAEGVIETDGASPFLLLVEAADLDEVHQDGTSAAATAGKTSGPSPVPFKHVAEGQQLGIPPAWGLPMILPRSGNLDVLQKHRREAAAASDASDGVLSGGGHGRVRKPSVRHQETPTSSTISLPRKGVDVMPEHSSRDAKHLVSPLGSKKPLHPSNDKPMFPGVPRRKRTHTFYALPAVADDNKPATLPAPARGSGFLDRPNIQTYTVLKSELGKRPAPTATAPSKSEPAPAPRRDPNAHASLNSIARNRATASKPHLATAPLHVPRIATAAAAALAAAAAAATARLESIATFRKEERKRLRRDPDATTPAGPPHVPPMTNMTRTGVVAAASALAASALAAAAARREEMTNTRKEEAKRLGLAIAERERSLQCAPAPIEENTNRVEGRCAFCEARDTLVWEQQQLSAPWRLVCESCGRHQQSGGQVEQQGASLSSGGRVGMDTNAPKAAVKSTVPTGTLMQTLQGKILARELERGEQRERDRTDDGPMGFQQASEGGHQYANTPHFSGSRSGPGNRVSNPDEHDRMSGGDKRCSQNGVMMSAKQVGFQQHLQHQHKLGTLEWECSQNESRMSQLAKQDDGTQLHAKQTQQAKQQQQSLGFVAKMKQDHIRKQQEAADTLPLPKGSSSNLVAHHLSSSPAEQQQQQKSKSSSNIPLPLQQLLEQHIQQAIQKSPVKHVSQQAGAVNGRASTATDSPQPAQGLSTASTVVATISEMALDMAKRRKQAEANGTVSQQAAAMVGKSAAPSFMLMYGQHHLQKQNIAAAANATAAFVASCAATAAAAAAVKAAGDLDCLRTVGDQRRDSVPGGGDSSDVECLGDFPATPLEPEGVHSVPTLTSALPNGLPQFMTQPPATATHRPAVAPPFPRPSLQKGRPSPATIINTLRPIAAASIPIKAQQPVISNGTQHPTPAVPLLHPQKQQQPSNAKPVGPPCVPNRSGIPGSHRLPGSMTYSLDTGVRNIVAPPTQPPRISVSPSPPLPLPTAQVSRPASASPAPQIPFPVILAPPHAPPASVRLPTPPTGPSQRTPSPAAHPSPAAILASMQEIVRQFAPLLAPASNSVSLLHAPVHCAEPSRLAVPMVYVPLMHARMPSPAAPTPPPRAAPQPPIIAGDSRSTAPIFTPSGVQTAVLQPQPSPSLSRFDGGWTLAPHTATTGVATIPASTAAAITIALAAAINAAKGGASAAASALTAGRTAAAAAAVSVGSVSTVNTDQQHQIQSERTSSDQLVTNVLVPIPQLQKQPSLPTNVASLMRSMSPEDDTRFSGMKLLERNAAEWQLQKDKARLEFNRSEMVKEKQHLAQQQVLLLREQQMLLMQKQHQRETLDIHPKPLPSLTGPPAPPPPQPPQQSPFTLPQPTQPTQQIPFMAQPPQHNPLVSPPQPVMIPTQLTPVPTQQQQQQPQVQPQAILSPIQHAQQQPQVQQQANRMTQQDHVQQQQPQVQQQASLTPTKQQQPQALQQQPLVSGVSPPPTLETPFSNLVPFGPHRPPRRSKAVAALVHRHSMEEEESEPIVTPNNDSPSSDPNIHNPIRGPDPTGTTPSPSPSPYLAPELVQNMVPTVVPAAMLLPERIPAHRQNLHLLERQRAQNQLQVERQQLLQDQQLLASRAAAGLCHPSLPSYPYPSLASSGIQHVGGGSEDGGGSAGMPRVRRPPSATLSTPTLGTVCTTGRSNIASRWGLLAKNIAEGMNAKGHNTPDGVPVVPAPVLSSNANPAATSPEGAAEFLALHAASFATLTAAPSVQQHSHLQQQQHQQQQVQQSQQQQQQQLSQPQQQQQVQPQQSQPQPPQQQYQQQQPQLNEYQQMQTTQQLLQPALLQPPQQFQQQQLQQNSQPHLQPLYQQQLYQPQQQLYQPQQPEYSPQLQQQSVQQSQQYQQQQSQQQQYQQPQQQQLDQQQRPQQLPQNQQQQVMQQEMLAPTVIASTFNESLRNVERQVQNPHPQATFNTAANQNAPHHQPAPQQQQQHTHSHSLQQLQTGPIMQRMIASSSSSPGRAHHAPGPVAGSSPLSSARYTSADERDRTSGGDVAPMHGGRVLLQRGSSGSGSAHSGAEAMASASQEEHGSGGLPQLPRRAPKQSSSAAQVNVPPVSVLLNHLMQNQQQQQGQGQQRLQQPKQGSSGVEQQLQNVQQKQQQQGTQHGGPHQQHQKQALHLPNQQTQQQQQQAVQGGMYNPSRPVTGPDTEQRHDVWEYKHNQPQNQQQQRQPHQQQPQQSFENPQGQQNHQAVRYQNHNSQQGEKQQRESWQQQGQDHRHQQRQEQTLQHEGQELRHSGSGQGQGQQMQGQGPPPQNHTYHNSNGNSNHYPNNSNNQDNPSNNHSQNSNPWGPVQGQCYAGPPRISTARSGSTSSASPSVSGQPQQQQQQLQQRGVQLPPYQPQQQQQQRGSSQPPTHSLLQAPQQQRGSPLAFALHAPQAPQRQWQPQQFEQMAQQWMGTRN